MQVTYPWAKIDPDAVGKSRGWHSLVDHCADVAACFEAMLAVPIPSSRLARLAGRERLPPTWAARLSAHVALHDFGKANTGFQARKRVGAPFVGHCGEAYAATQHEATRERLMRVLPFAQMERWGAFAQAQLTMLAHHGRPLDPMEDHRAARRHWREKDGYDPIGALAPLGAEARAWFPAAFEQGGEPLPDLPLFWHGVLGLVTLADWLGSDTTYFPFAHGLEADRMAWARLRAPEALRQIGFDPARQRTPEVAANAAAFASVSAHTPLPVQRAAGEAPGHLVILESETGSGKTEAALWRFARLFAAGEVDGLYFALPTRVAATSLHARVKAAVARLFPDPDARPEVTLAVPGMAKDLEAGRGAGLSGQAPDATENRSDALRASHWAAERPKRFLAGTIAVGTVDQALLAAVHAKHAHLRLACLLRHLLVVDEVHASDAYMGRLLGHLLSIHGSAGGHALLLSATLGSAARAKLLGGPRTEPPPLKEAIACPYPALSTNLSPSPRAQEHNGRDRTIDIALNASIAEPRAIAQMALDAARRGAKTLVVRNLRRDAIAVFQAVLDSGGIDLLLSCAGVPALHHGRFAREDRRRLDGAVEAALGRERACGGSIVIGTQTLEQSLDIDADYLITDLCPADVLLQRLGRLHRHLGRAERPAGFAAPRALVLTPPDMAALLKRGAHGLGFFASGGQTIAFPYADLIAVEATQRAILDYPVWRIPKMNRLLVELATHPEAREKLLSQLAPADVWREADNAVGGRLWAQNSAAARALLRINVSFDDEQIVMPADEPHSSRLGAKDILIVFDPPVVGPFGAKVRQIALPDYWTRGVDPGKDLAPKVEARDGGFEFAVQGVKFGYDNKGVTMI